MLHLFGHHTCVCSRHRIWIGPPDLTNHPQPSLEELPEVVAAQHRHLRLLRCIVPAATYDAVLIVPHLRPRLEFTLVAAPEDG